MEISGALWVLLYCACELGLCVTKDDDNSEHLTDGNPDTYWETDGGVGMHWIKINMKPTTIIRYVVVNLCRYCVIQLTGGHLGDSMLFLLSHW